MAEELERAADPVAAKYQSMLVAFDATMGNATRDGAVPAIRRLPELVPEGDRLLAFVTARMTAPAKEWVVLAATTSRIIAFRERDLVPAFNAPRALTRAIDYTTDWNWGTRLDVAGDGRSATFRRLQPGPQGARIFFLLGGEDRRPGTLDLLGDLPPDPGHPPLAAIWNLALYEDRLIDHEGRHLPFAGGDVHATCDTAGAIAVTRGRNLAAKGVGTLMLGPVGLFGMGNAKERAIDTRELYLLVEGPGWAYTQQFVPDLGGPLRQFAQTINVVAAEHARRSAPAPPAAGAGPASGDPIAQLRELAALHAEGILTAEEFAAQKARLLDRM